MCGSQLVKFSFGSRLKLQKQHISAAGIITGSLERTYHVSCQESFSADVILALVKEMSDSQAEQGFSCSYISFFLVCTRHRPDRSWDHNVLNGIFSVELEITIVLISFVINLLLFAVICDIMILNASALIPTDAAVNKLIGLVQFIYIVL